MYQLVSYCIYMTPSVVGQHGTMPKVSAVHARLLPPGGLRVSSGAPEAFPLRGHRPFHPRRPAIQVPACILTRACCALDACTIPKPGAHDHRHTLTVTLPV